MFNFFTPTQTNVNFVDSSEIAGQSFLTHVFVGLKGNLSRFKASIPEKCPGLDEKTVRMLLDRLHPGRDAPVSVETTVFGSDGTPRRCIFGALPLDCSRHNTPARSNAIHVLMKQISLKTQSFPVCVTLVSDRADTVQASATAVARAFPTYNHRSSRAQFGTNEITVNVSLVDAASGSMIDTKEIQTVMTSTRLCAALVDMPTSELHTDRFVEIAKEVANEVGASSSTMATSVSP